MGEYLSTDHPSGRIIKFPNSEVLSAAIYKYSWPLFPYIWNEIKFQIAHDSDLDFVSQVMQEEAEAEVGSAMMDRVRVFRELLAQTPVDRLEVRERPAVFFRVSDYTWLEAVCRYIVEPRMAGRVKNRLIRKMRPTERRARACQVPEGRCSVTQGCDSGSPPHAAARGGSRC